MNLAEFPLSVIGRRAPRGVKTIEFHDEVKDPNNGNAIKRHVTVTGSDLLGLPTSVDDEVLVGCLKLTKDYGLELRRVPFTAYQFLEELGWARDGKNYRRLTKSLDRWTATRVFSNNAFWHKGKQKLIKDSFGLIDRWQLTGETTSDATKAGWFVWGDFVWESLQAGNIRTLDFEFWKNLESPVAKRLFRFLDKRFYKRKKISFPLKTLAYDKVAISRNLHTGQIKESLRRGHQELEAKGFCKSVYVEHGRGNWEVVYTDLRRIGKEKHVRCVETGLVRALKQRGISRPEDLIKLQSSEGRIKSAIENYDDRLAHGERLTPRWLAACILHETGYDFRDDYKSEEERQATAIRRAKSKQRAAAKRKIFEAQERERREQEKQHLAEYLRGLGSEAARAEFQEQALQANRFLRLQCNEVRSEQDAAPFIEAALLAHWRTVARK